MQHVAAVLDQTRSRNPLIHCITNYVTVNDCANIILAAGGSPIMADDIREAEEIAGLCSALVLNIGTLTTRTLEAMLAAGKRANQLGRPVVLDPVGAGASGLRNEALQELLRQVRFAVIKGNSSEIGFLADGLGSARGVDADAGSLAREGNLAAKVRQARELSERSGAVIAISGPIDILAHSHEAWAVRNGNPLMARVTGSGCMTAAIMGCCLGASPPKTPEGALRACLCAVCAMGVCGELAAERMAGSRDQGTGSYRVLLMDAMSALDGKTLAARARVEELQGAF